MQTLTTKAQREGTAVIICAFTDEEGTAVSPDSLNWTLTDGNETVINSRENVEVTGPDLSSSVEIVLSGDDLAVQSEETDFELKRILWLEGTYTSTYGSSMPLRKAVAFFIENP